MIEISLYANDPTAPPEDAERIVAEVRLWRCNQLSFAVQTAAIEVARAFGTALGYSPPFNAWAQVKQHSLGEIWDSRTAPPCQENEEAPTNLTTVTVKEN